jgi:hypothetical protein
MVLDMEIVAFRGCDRLLPENGVPDPENLFAQICLGICVCESIKVGSPPDTSGVVSL